MPKTVPNASNSYPQLSPTWYNLKQPLKPNISKYMLKNDEKTKIALLLQSSASKILLFYSPPDPIKATYTPYNPSATPTSFVVP